MIENYIIEPFDSNNSYSTLYKGIHKLKKHKVIINKVCNENLVNSNRLVKIACDIVN